MAKNLFSYGKGKRDISHSKFDMSFNSLRGDNFGSLSLEALYETLPDDFWHLSHNTLTKVAVMNSPAFTRIHQNHYAFYVRNQQVWEHWNNYITNGTAFGDVYGSNLTNQATDNPWKVPTISANDLQLILKIANGFAIPVYRFEIDFEEFLPTSKRYGFTFDTDPQVSTFQFYSRLTPFISALAYGDPDYSFLNYVPYFEVYYGHYSKQRKLYFEIFGSHTQVQVVAKRFGLVPLIYKQDLESDAIGETFETNFDSTQHLEPVYQTFRLFSDDHSSDVSISNAPFLLTRKILHSYKNIDLNDYVYELNRNSGLFNRWFGYGGDLVDNGNIYFSFSNPFDGTEELRYHFSASLLGLSGQSTQEDFNAVKSSLHPYMGYTTENIFSLLDNTTDKIEDNGNMSWVLYGSESESFDKLSLAIPYTSNFNFRDYTALPQIKSIGKNLPSDLILPLYSDNVNYVDYNGVFYARFRQPAQHPLTDSLGYYSLAFLIYQCKSVASLLDDFNLPTDALSVRNTLDYRFEEFNALPFFGYSKIWNDHFRNLAVSSPELDFRQTNGSMLFDADRRVWLNDSTLIRPEILPEQWQDVVIDQAKVNSWVIPFCAQPKTGITEDFSNYQKYPQLLRLLDGKNHYLNVRNYIDVFVLLTGYFIDNWVIDQLYTQEIKLNNTASISNMRYIFNDLFTSKFYLPSYYNGLLHKKYQNFNKDYFSSAMLDPMSGANQVELGSTVNELRTNQAKQGWFETIAQARSVKGFFQAIFGITPELEHLSPQLCGSDHVDINIGEVIQTSQSDQTPQGTRTGLGSARGDGNLIHQKCNEHGFILVLVSHTLESQYFQGIEKMWLPKKSYMDYPTIDFANIGNESILQKEINFSTQPSRVYNRSWQHDPTKEIVENLGFGRVRYNAQGNPRLQTVYTPSRGGVDPGIPTYREHLNVAQKSGTSLDNIFGYVPRFSTYKFKLDECHGIFKYGLQYWQSFRKFTSQPVLSHEFVNWEFLADSEELNKMFAVQDDYLDSKFLLDIFINSYVSRALPYVCVPHSK